MQSTPAATSTLPQPWPHGCLSRRVALCPLWEAVAGATEYHRATVGS